MSDIDDLQRKIMREFDESRRKTEAALAKSKLLVPEDWFKNVEDLPEFLKEQAE